MATITFTHVALTCKEPIEIEKFYCKHFGFERARVFNPGPEQFVMIKLGDIHLELFKADKESPESAPVETGQVYPGWRHIAFSVENLDSKLAEIGDDAKITHGPLDLSEFIPGWRVWWIADPEGNIIELSQGYTD